MRTLASIALGCLLVIVALAGCADDSQSTSGEEDPGVGATETTGGIRGVVVDQAIVPIEGVTVQLQDSDLATETDGEGMFVFSDLEPGTYFVEAHHPFYSEQQASTVVEAGVDRPTPLRIQLTQVIFDEPQMVPYAFQGYIFCSANTPVGLSEECGEGTGYPCDLPPTLYACGDRVGKNPENVAGQEWYIEVPGMVTMIVEQNWKPSVEISLGEGGLFRTYVSENWVCDPFCRDDYRFNGRDGTTSAAPLYVRIDMEDHESFAYNETTRFTTFTYAGDNPGILLEQPYELFVHTFHLLPAPEGWSIANGDEDPFKL